VRILEYLLVGGTVYDGTSVEPVDAAVGIAGDRVVVFRDGGGGDIGSGKTIDVRGLVVAPGFVDPHGSSALRHLLPGGAAPKLFQGVTTEVCGHCGYSEYPVETDWARTDLAAEAGAFGLTPNWSDSFSFGAALTAAGLGVNVVLLVGLNRLLTATADPAESLRAEMNRAASGLSSGLVYPPGMTVSTSMLADLASVARDGHHSMHLRNEREHLLDAVAEAVDMASASGTPTIVAHLKAAERDNWGRLGDAVDLIRAARDDGVPITFEAYPYRSVSTRARTFLPPALSALGPSEVASALCDERYRSAAVSHLAARGTAFGSMTVSSSRFGGRLGHPVGDADSFLDLLVDDPDYWVVYDCLDQNDVDTAMLTPWALVCTDTWSLPFNGVDDPRSAHPRTFGGIARFIHRYALTEGHITLGEAIRRVTSLPASWLGLRDRGILTTGAFADIVVFDPQAYADRASFADPLAPAEGMRYVFVNGRPQIIDGELLDPNGGRILQAAGKDRARAI
jgi:N-acyl-D-amino-acid deacylase